MQNDKNFRPDRIGAYFRIEWLPLALENDCRTIPALI